MTEDNQNPSASASIPAALVLNQSDNPRTQLISCHLNGQNYITWSNAMLIALQAKTKLGFIDGTVKKPDESDPLYEQWVTYNSMLVMWFFNATILKRKGFAAVSCLCTGCKSLVGRFEKTLLLRQ
ncbi:hypothetical protein CDL15_Pgr021770 [Punica granatum]|uniref:Retrotransposon Copia-like N-terminal domain-containing protein n=1 Tax=Punica granatum TaxID=22663 RepID=A0A218WS40_PUNGR|nr:hypothetical protein CDL15_Pgr021770 [Punica granatum]